MWAQLWVTKYIVITPMIKQSLEFEGKYLLGVRVESEALWEVEVD